MAHGTIHRLDRDVSVHVDTTRTHRAPNYKATIDGEQFPLYLINNESTALPSSQTVHLDDKYLVAFLDPEEESWWWADQGGAATRDEAETLLLDLADGRDGKGFIVPAPTFEAGQ